VTGVTSTGNVNLVRSLGAHHVVDYTTTDFARSGRRYDLILDTVSLRGGKDIAMVSAHATAEDLEFLSELIEAGKVGPAIDRQLRGERLFRLFLQRVHAELGLGRAVRRNLGTPDDHHEQLVRADQRNGRPRGHRCAGQATRGERILSKPRRPISETNFSLLAWEARTAQQMWACASKRPSAGGNIGSRRRAALGVQDFGLYGWPCACCGLW
jgi:hypothetical protein